MVQLAYLYPLDKKITPLISKIWRLFNVLKFEVIQHDRQLNKAVDERIKREQVKTRILY